jgi:hypothetical protein
VTVTCPSADRHWVKHIFLISGLPTSLSINVVGMLNLSIEVTTGGTTIVFGDDTLTPLVRQP